MSKKAEYVSMENTWYTWKNLGQGNNTISVSTILKPRRTYREIFEAKIIFLCISLPSTGTKTTGFQWAGIFENA